MKKLSIYKFVMKKAGAFWILGTFILFVFVVAGIIFLIEPDINSYADSLWYCYANLFTIGFGDLVPTTFVGRILSVLLTVYATFVIAVLTGVVVSVYTEILNRRFKASKEVLLDKLTRLPELSKEELKELSDRVKELN